MFKRRCNAGVLNVTSRSSVATWRSDISWREWPIYSAACRQDVQRLLRNGTSLTAYKANPKHGPEPRHGSWTWKLERETEQVHQVPHVIVCANGTLALTTLLKVLYPEGRKIFTTAFTFSATVTAILQAGLTPIFSDVTITDGLLNLAGTNPFAQESLPVDLFGKQSLVSENAVDACQSVGIVPRAVHGVWSFNGRKNVPAGEGGAIFTKDADVAARCRLAINHAENFVNYIGGNGHMNEVTACIAYHGMKKVLQHNAHRTNMAKVLNAALAMSPVITPDLTNHALYMYPLIVEKGMEEVADRLFMQGIICQRGYIQPPLHQYPAFKHIHIHRGDLHNTESLSRDRLLLFPQVTPTATRQEMEELGDKIREALG